MMRDVREASGDFDRIQDALRRVNITLSELRLYGQEEKRKRWMPWQ